jgi:hypothetical protein
MLGRSLGAALVLLLAAAAPVAADRGVAVDLGLVEIDQPLYAGGMYRLPTLGVRNPGDEPGRYLMRVGQTGSAGVMAMDESWFSFTPAAFALEPGGTVPVTISMHLPTDVEPGRYEGLLSAELAAEGEGALVGAAAAARLTFEVRPSSSFEAVVRAVLAAIDGLRPWSYVVPLLILAAFVLWRLSRRFNVRLERRA